VLVRGIDTLEVSDCEVIGTQRYLDVRNARFSGNHFANPMGVSWTDIGGQHIVFETESGRGRLELASRYAASALDLWRRQHHAQSRARRARGVHLRRQPRPGHVPGRSAGGVEPWVGPVGSASKRDVRLAKGELPAGAYADSMRWW
jgi:hypothetical protein